MPKPATRPYSHYSRDAVVLLGQLIRRARIERKITANELAERAGLSQQMVSYVERGIRRPTLDTIFRMSLALEVDLGRIIRDVIKNAELRN